jgi:polar amino acid transport system substrate-binding protein
VTPRTRNLHPTTLASLTALTVLLTACGSSGDTTSPAGSVPAVSAGGSPAGSAAASASVAPSGVVVDAAAALVPADIRERGTLVVATGEGYPPFEFYAEGDTTNLQGVDPELVSAVAGALGLQPELQILKFDGIIPGLQGGRYDMAAAAMGVTQERNQVVDFVTYFEGGTSIMTPAGNPQNLSLDNLCGHRIAAQKGTIYADNYLPKFSADCTAKGEPEITVDIYPDAAQTNLAVGSNRAEAVVSDFGPLAYTAQQSDGQFFVLDASYDPAPYGFALPKGSELAPAVEAALEAVIADGTYQQVLEKWDVTTGAITDPTISRG